MNEQVIIDPEFRDLLPPLTEDEYSRLETLCRKQGILDSLKVWNGFLIDGHNRLSISQAWDLNYEVRDMTDDFPNKAAVMQWIIDNQGARRNLTKEQLVKAWSKWEKERAKEAEAVKLSTLKQNADSANLNERTDPIRTAAEVAKKIGVSENTYRDMKLITDEGTPEQIERMNKGGKGNGVSRIAGEIRVKKISAQEIKEKKCTKCGRILPIENFYWKRLKGRYETQCKECQNAYRVSVDQIKDVKGNVIQNTGEFSAIPEDQIIGNLYDDSSIEVTISDVIQEFMTNFNTALKNLEAILKNNNSVISEHKNEISEMLNQASDKFQTLRKEYEQ